MDLYDETQLEDLYDDAAKCYWISLLQLPA